MGIEGFILGFALLVVGLALGFLVKVRFGWLVIVGCAVVLGAFGWGYCVGRQTAHHDMRGFIHNLLTSEPGGNQLIVDGWLSKLGDGASQLESSFWLQAVCVFMVTIGIAVFLILVRIELARARRAGELGIAADKVKVEVSFE